MASIRACTGELGRGGRTAVVYRFWEVSDADILEGISGLGGMADLDELSCGIPAGRF